MNQPMSEIRFATHLKTEAQKDDIQVHVKVVEGVRYFTVGNSKYWYKTKEGAMAHVHYLQSQLAPDMEVRS